MQRVGTREFKNRQSRYLRAVRAGQTLVITARGKAVAKLSLTGEEKSDPNSLRERLEELQCPRHDPAWPPQARKISRREEQRKNRPRDDLRTAASICNVDSSVLVKRYAEYHAATTRFDSDWRT